jgi:RNA polymerase sigma-70 factor (ECF subfamily)
MAAFEAGEPGAGERLYDRLVPVVDATIARILGGRESDHADLVQAAFEQIVGTLMRRRYAGRCSLTGWAASIACHVGLNALRARRRERRVIERRTKDEASDTQLGIVERAPAPTSLDTQLGARDELAAVRLALAHMAPDRVTTLLLNAMGHDLSEIAELTQTSVAAAQSRLSRARRELRQKLGDGHAGDLDDPSARLK